MGTLMQNLHAGLVRTLLQRAKFGLLALDPRYVSAVHWIKSGWSTSRPQLEQRMLVRVAQQIERFKTLGLLTHWPAGAVPLLKGWADLQSLPVLGRTELRELFPLLKQHWGDSQRAQIERSSGSTGEPTRFYKRRGYNPQGLAFHNVMMSTLSWQPGMLRLAMWGSDREIGMNSPHPSQLRQLGGLYLFGGFTPDEAEYRRFYEAIRDSGGCAVYGYSSLLAHCARLMVERGWQLPAGCVKTAWTGAEMQFPHQRQIIGQALGVEPRDTYGGRECGWMAVECDHGTRHINPRYVIESLQPQTMAQQPDGQVGELAVTDLFHEFTPFIRYLIGDLGAVEWRECACGRHGFCLRELSGRISDMITLPSGTVMCALLINQIVQEHPVIKQAQVVRTSPTAFEFQYIGDEMPADEFAELQVLLAQKFAGAQTAVRRVGRLELTRVGKLMQYRDISQS